MKIVLRLLVGVLAGFLAQGYVSIAAADVALVAAKDLGATSISSKQAKQLWLGKKKKLPNVGRVTLIDQARDSVAREAFYISIVGKNTRQMDAYWAKVVFTGKGFPMKELVGDEAVKQWVNNNKSGLGYINSEAIDDSVQVLLLAK